MKPQRARKKQRSQTTKRQSVEQKPLENQWYVPFQNGRACIYHGHERPDDHSECGPQIFCCPNAARVLLSRHPDAVPGSCEWELTNGEHLLSWAHGELQIMYFFYCDPQNRDRIYFVGIGLDSLAAVLRREISLHTFDESADIIDAGTEP